MRAERLAMTSRPGLRLLGCAWCAIALCLAPRAVVGQAPRTPSAPPVRSSAAAVSGFAPVGDTQMYYESQGTGDAILFLHGGGGSLAASWPPDYARDLSRSHRVIFADSRGHGRTEDGNGPITYGRLAFDVIRLLDHLKIERAHIVGHSMGAITALHVLVDFPDRVRTATLLAGAYHVDNYQPEAYTAMRQELDQVIQGANATSRWASRAPAVLKKLRDSLLTGPTLTVPVLETISRPTLIVAAGHDIFFATAIAEDMHAHIKGSELIVLPDATHRVQVTNAAEVVAGIRGFIARRAAP
jgi:pimeloyl-ACP methyl ester carboxylesterase